MPLLLTEVTTIKECDTCSHIGHFFSHALEIICCFTVKMFFELFSTLYPRVTKQGKVKTGPTRMTSLSQGGQSTNLFIIVNIKIVEHTLSLSIMMITDQKAFKQSTTPSPPPPPPPPTAFKIKLERVHVKELGGGPIFLFELYIKMPQWSKDEKKTEPG